MTARQFQRYDLAASLPTPLQADATVSATQTHPPQEAT